jgi:hypothetical protein
MEGPVELLRSLSGQSLALAKRMSAYNGLLPEPVGNVHARSRALAEIGGLVEAFPDSDARRQIEAWRRAESADVEQALSEFRFEFGRRLADGLEGSSLAIRGQLPVLRVGLFTLRTDFDAGSATVYWGPEVEKLRAGLRLVPADLAATLRKWNDGLRQKSIEPQKLATRLHAAYTRTIAFRGLEPGARVFLLDLLAELVMLLQPESFRLNPAQEKFVEYPRVRFSYDLYRLKQAGAFTVGAARLKLHVANFDATTEKSKALWVPDNDEGDGTHYSYLSFGGG